MRFDFDTFLIFNGEGQAAMEYYKRVFGDYFEIVQVLTFGELEDGLISKDERDKINYAEIRLFEKNILLCDCLDFYHSIYSKGTNIMMSVALSDKLEVEKIFNQFAEEGQVIFSLAETQVTNLFGVVIDKFGITWMISQRPKGRKIKKYSQDD